MTKEVINEIAQLEKVCRHFHLSLQSGCDETLKRMGRKYTTGEYREIVERLKEALPGVAITTDVMVGFPGKPGKSLKNLPVLAKSWPLQYARF